MLIHTKSLAQNLDILSAYLLPDIINLISWSTCSHTHPELCNNKAIQGEGMDIKTNADLLSVARSRQMTLLC